MLRRLIIDESQRRIDALRQWLSRDSHAVVATSAVRAFRMIELDPGALHPRFLPDHDIGEQIPVHYVNWQGGSAMQQAMEGTGLAVTRVRFFEERT